MNTRSLLVGLVFFGAGIAAHALVPAAVAGEGAWKCYVVDRMPDMKAAAEWKGAINYATGLNEVAASAPVGTVLVGQYPVSSFGGSQMGGAPIMCVKN